MTRLLIAAFAAVLLAGCGFHLRGELAMPAGTGPIRVLAQAEYSPLADSLVLALNRAGVQAGIEGGMEGASTLNIRFEKWGSLPISIDPQGRAQEYTLRYAVIFDMRRPDGSVVVPEQTVELARDYISIPTQSEGTESEQDILRREMEREMVATILRRIDAVSKAVQPVEAETTQSP